MALPNRQAPPSAALVDTDHQLLEATRAGDLKAYGRFVERHQRRILRLTAHLLRDTSEAEDVTQETFVRAYRALERFDGRSEPFTWVYRIAVNLSLNTLRARRTRRTAPLEDEHQRTGLVEARAGYADPAQASADRELGALLLAGLDSLSESLRTTLILVAYDGLSHAEAGAVLGCPEGTVAWRTHEARKKLRSFLATQGITVEEAP